MQSLHGSRPQEDAHCILSWTHCGWSLCQLHPLWSKVINISVSRLRDKEERVWRPMGRDCMGPVWEEQSLLPIFHLLEPVTFHLLEPVTWPVTQMQGGLGNVVPGLTAVCQKWLHSGSGQMAATTSVASTPCAPTMCLHQVMMPFMPIILGCLWGRIYIITSSSSYGVRPSEMS